MNNSNKILSKKDKELIEYLRDNLKSRFSDFKKLYFFGSRVKGNFNDESDYDIVVITNKKNREMEDYTISLISEADYKYDVFIELHVLTEKEFHWNPFFFEEVTKYGLLYE